MKRKKVICDTQLLIKKTWQNSVKIVNTEALFQEGYTKVQNNLTIFKFVIDSKSRKVTFQKMA
jgi:hypothetical protein